MSTKPSARIGAQSVLLGVQGREERSGKGDRDGDAGSGVALQIGGTGEQVAAERQLLHDRSQGPAEHEVQGKQGEVPLQVDESAEVLTTSADVVGDRHQQGDVQQGHADGDGQHQADQEHGTSHPMGAQRRGPVRRTTSDSAAMATSTRDGMNASDNTATAAARARSRHDAPATSSGARCSRVPKGGLGLGASRYPFGADQDCSPPSDRAWAIARKPVATAPNGGATSAGSGI